MLRPRFVLFGDSLTQRSFEDGGFGAGLTNAYQRKVKPRALPTWLCVLHSLLCWRQPCSTAYKGIGIWCF